MRLDIYLKENKNIKSRARAKLLIESDKVTVNGLVHKNCSYNVKDGDTITVEDMLYVSRAGYKLKYAAEYLQSSKDSTPITLDFTNKKCLDIGSSTGGFTDFLLQNGADLVCSVDVGSEQFDISLIEKYQHKIKLFENTDIRNVDEIEYFKNKKSEGGFDIIVCDVAFISLTHIVPSIQKYMKEGGFGLILFKPQFEVGRENNKSGIVKDQSISLKFLDEMIEKFSLAGIKVIKHFKSGVVGGDGNTEYMLYITK